MLTRAHTARNLMLGLLAVTLLAACLNDDDGGDDALETVVSNDSIVVPTASPTATVEPTPTTSAWISALLEPGPTTSAPNSIYFLNGPDVWIINADMSVSQVTRERRVRGVATAPDGSQAAAIFLGAIGGREAEEIRIIDSEGEESEPIFGPEIVGNPGGNPRIGALAWSPDGSQLAFLRGDGSLWLAGPEREPEQILASTGGTPEQLAWAPSGAGIAMLARQPGGAGVVHVVSLAEGERVDITPAGSFGELGWLPGQASLVVAEDRAAGLTPAAGALFTIQPDGTERELLLSAGEFGPVVEITHLTPSPDGALLAFVVNAPNPEGLMEFQALWVRELESGVLRQFRVAPGQGVNDLWWFANGLAWRATPAAPNDTYDGAEPFIIEFADLESGTTQLVFTAG